MSKKLKDLKWQSVALEGFPASVTDNLQGFVGLEECTNYGFDKGSKRPQKKKPQKKRKKACNDSETQVPHKKVKLSNGFIVESCNSVTPSGSLENPMKEVVKESKNTKKETSKTSSETVRPSSEPVKPVTVQNNKKKKHKLGEDIGHNVSNLTPEDMLSWAEFKLPEPIVKALMEMGYKQPTKIQQMSMPAAIHGRRDILGAAETGSGKTLAFGLPILTGILNLKEKAESRGLDVYDIPYRKPPNKKEEPEPQKTKKNGKKNLEVLNNKNKKNPDRNKNKKNKIQEKIKESSEDGYSSGENSEGEETETKRKSKIVSKKGANKKELKSVKSSIKVSSKDDDDDFIEEIGVPIKKRNNVSEDEGNDSDDDENFIHLSDMLDSDDLDDNSTDEEKEETSDEKESDEESAADSENKNDNSETDSVQDSDEESSQEVEELSGDESGDDSGEGSEIIEEEGDEMAENTGMGCVKVLDNIEMPGPVSTKTGKPLYALILTPTRELAMQVSGHLKAAAKYTGIRIATIVGGMAVVKQERVLKGGPEVVVATPGRLWELLQQGQPHLQQIDFVKFLAIDETDRMLERGHFEELKPLLERLNTDEARRCARQNFVFSATLTLVHTLPAHMQGKKVTKNGKIINRKIQKMTPQQKINKFIKMFGMSDPKVVDITQENLGTAETLTECRIACSLTDKDAYLYYILKRHVGRTIVFCNSIGCVRRLAQLLTILECRPLPLHAEMQQKQRLKNLERFRDDPKGVLVATDVAARGLDIPDVDHVIHFQVPRTAENYVHRSGRTARASKEGLTILMMEPSEAFLYSKLCRTLNKTAEVPHFPIPSTALSPFRDILSVARELETLELKRRRATQAAGWRERAAREMDIIIDEDDVPITTIDTSLDKAIKAKRAQLRRLKSRPLFPKGFSYKYPTLNDPSALEWSDENALQVMKKAIESGELKKEKRKSKNAPLLKLEKNLKKKKTK